MKKRNGGDSQQPKDRAALERRVEALEHYEAELRRLFENLPDLVVVVDRQARIQFANRAVGAVGPDRLIGSTGFDHILPEHRQRCQEALQQALATGEVRRVEVLDEYGFWWDARVVPVTEGDKPPRAMVICSDVTHAKQAEERAREESRVVRHLLDAYEQHRKLAAFEVHDVIAQPLVGAIMDVEASLNAWRRQCPEALVDGFESALGLLRDVLAEARRLMVGLRPSALDDFGVLVAVDHLVREARAHGQTDIQWSHRVQFDRLAPPLEATLFRIIQEGLANALRHSGSPRVRVSLVQSDDGIHVSIEDWGCGFEPREATARGFGLRGILERARLFNGQATIDSAPGRGTRLLVLLPAVHQTPADDDLSR